MYPNTEQAQSNFLMHCVSLSCFATFRLGQHCDRLSWKLAAPIWYHAHVGVDFQLTG